MAMYYLDVLDGLDAGKVHLVGRSLSAGSPAETARNLFHDQAFAERMLAQAPNEEEIRFPAA